MQFVIVSGMSGAGITTALKTLEDFDYFCVDNLPVQLIDKFAEVTVLDQSYDKDVALGIDIRNGKALGELDKVLTNLAENDVNFKILFLDATDQALVKRYKETRRSHPLSKNERIEKGIEREREALQFLRGKADYIIDTSYLLTREFRAEMERIFKDNEEYGNLNVTILSFGFKYGIPNDSDLVFDVRFLPNPYYLEELRPKTGNDIEVKDYVMQAKEAALFLNKLEDLVRFLMPQYAAEGKNQLVISVGCTGGKHRSVTLANALYERLYQGRDYGLRIEHRDIEKDAARGK